MAGPDSELDLDRDCVPGLKMIQFVTGKLKIDLTHELSHIKICDVTGFMGILMHAVKMSMLS